jgi:CheY-like chemotaxis protein
MSELTNFRIALLSGGALPMGSAIVPLLMAQTDSLLVVESVDDLLVLNQLSGPEIIFVCHNEGHDGITAAELLRAHFVVTPLVLLAKESFDTLKAAVAIGALAVLEPPFAEATFAAVFNHCRHQAVALRWEAQKQQQYRSRSELFMKAPCCQLFVAADGMVTFLNDAAAALADIDSFAVHAFNEFSRRFFAPHASTYPHEIELAVQDGTPWQGILSGRMVNGLPGIYRVDCVPLSQAVNGAGVLITLHDITAVVTEQAQLRLDLQAARDLLALADEAEARAEAQRYCLANSSTTLAPESFSLPELLASVLKSAGAKAKQAVPDYLPLHFLGDAGRLRCLLRTLIGGGAYGEGDLQISLSIKERTSSGMTIQFGFHVTDNAEQSQSYQPVAEYLAAAVALPGAANGLGLAAVLCGQLNGTLLIRTQRGLGRTVICAVPLVPEDEVIMPVSSPANRDSAEGDEVVPDDSPGPFSALKILVAEDNLIEQVTLKHLLTSIGCRVVVVGNGKEAVDECETGEFNVVLMDILMPVMDGFEATRLIRERERVTGGKIPVVALTSYSLKAIQEKCVKVGMNGYLAKPVAKTKLIEALLRLNKQQELSAQAEGIMAELQDFPVFEAQAVLDNIDYDLELFRELVEMYLTSCAGLGDELVEKLAGDDIKDILSSAHTLKGVAANIGGHRMAEVTRQIQDLCREGKKPDRVVWAPIVKAQTVAIKESLENIDWSDLERLVAAAGR